MQRNVQYQEYAREYHRLSGYLSGNERLSRCVIRYAICCVSALPAIHELCSTSKHRGALVLVEPLPGLAAEFARRDHALHQRRHRCAGVVGRGVERFRHEQMRVETDEIEQL